MAYRVIWSDEASDDLKAIAEYIERDSPRYAAAVVDKITALTRNLPKFPRLGRAVPELEREDIRERFMFSYRIVYQLREDSILIVNVIHGRRQYRHDVSILN
ncbi:MAG: type II toxin-antitoxin system RelE/ParE family toxin [Gammaproteobacteria bacterium]